MASFFYRLLRLGNGVNNRDEDFLTEVFAEVLREDPSRVGHLLLQTNSNIDEWSGANVATQYRFKKIGNHESDSIIDLVIIRGDQMIAVENKLGAGEGYQQLQRYSDHLAQYDPTGRLIYLTQHHDPKNDTEVYKDIPAGRFLHVRWYEIYCKAVASESKTHLLNLFIELLENMSLHNSLRFDPADLLAMVRFPQVNKMMQEVLFGQVSDVFNQWVPDAGRNSISLPDLRDRARYINLAWQGEYWIGYGFWLQDENDSLTYPEVRLVLELKPGTSGYAPRVDYLRNVVEQPESDWIGYDLNRPKEWGGIKKVLKLETILSESNQVSYIEDFLLKALESARTVFGIPGGCSTLIIAGKGVTECPLVSTPYRLGSLPNPNTKGIISAQPSGIMPATPDPDAITK